MTRYIFLFDNLVLLLWGALSDERTGLSFVYAVGPCRRSLSRARVPRDSRPYFTVSDLRVPFSSPPATSCGTVFTASDIESARTHRKHGLYCWRNLFTARCLAMESPFPIVGQEFFFAGTWLPNCSLATDVLVIIFYCKKFYRWCVTLDISDYLLSIAQYSEQNTSQKLHVFSSLVEKVRGAYTVGSVRKDSSHPLDPVTEVNKLQGTEPFLKSRQILSYWRVSQHFMKPEGSLPCS
jgi:hypothetical protein